MAPGTPPGLCSYIALPPLPATLSGDPAEQSPGPWEPGLCQPPTRQHTGPNSHVPESERAIKTTTAAAISSPAQSALPMLPVACPHRCTCQKPSPRRRTGVGDWDAEPRQGLPRSVSKQRRQDSHPGLCKNHRQEPQHDGGYAESHWAARPPLLRSHLPIKTSSLTGTADGGHAAI